MLVAKRLRMVPSAALAGLVAPMRIAPFLDGVGRFQNHDDHGAFGHELHQRAVEGPLAMDGVEALRFELAQAFHFHAGDAESGFLGDGDNVAGLVGGYGVGFDDCECTFHILLEMFFDSFADFGGRGAHIDAGGLHGGDLVGGLSAAA